MPLHFGRMPRWFTENMGDLTKAVIESVVQNYGKSELLTRMSDPSDMDTSVDFDDKWK